MGSELGRHDVLYMLVTHVQNVIISIFSRLAHLDEDVQTVWMGYGDHGFGIWLFDYIADRQCMLEGLFYVHDGPLFWYVYG